MTATLLDILPRNYTKSPIHYIGSKRNGVAQILSLIPVDVGRVCSPFLGGGSVELAIASCGVPVHGYDEFELLVSLWKGLLIKPIELAWSVEARLPVTDAVYNQMRLVDAAAGLFERAVAAAIILQTSFKSLGFYSGVRAVGVQGNISDKYLKRVKRFRAPHLTVDEGDAFKTVAECGNKFLYLDPPYFIKRRMYGRREGLTCDDFDHWRLSALLDRRGSWVLSYNDCPQARSIYARYRILKPMWKYGLGKNRNAREILIISNDIPQGIVDRWLQRWKPEVGTWRSGIGAEVE